MVRYRATIKERGKDGYLHPEYLIPNDAAKYVEPQFFIDFWGLEMMDVEWYKVEAFGEDGRRKLICQHNNDEQ